MCLSAPISKYKLLNRKLNLTVAFLANEKHERGTPAEDPLLLCQLQELFVGLNKRIVHGIGQIIHHKWIFGDVFVKLLGQELTERKNTKRIAYKLRSKFLHNMYVHNFACSRTALAPCTCLVEITRLHARIVRDTLLTMGNTVAHKSN